MIRITPFGGMLPRVSARLLQAHQAQLAENCKLASGEVRPLRAPAHVLTPTLAAGAVKGIYRWRAGVQDYWFRFPSDVDVARSPIADDANLRVYFTGDTRFAEPRMTYAPAAYTGGDEYPVTSYKLGVPAPEAAPTTVLHEPASGALETMTRERPIKVTSAGHGLRTGQMIKLDGILPASEPDEGFSALNGEMTARVVRLNADEITLERNVDDAWVPWDGSAYWAHNGTGEWKTYVSFLGDLKAGAWKRLGRVHAENPIRIEMAAHGLQTGAFMGFRDIIDRQSGDVDQFADFNEEVGFVRVIDEDTFVLENTDGRDFVEDYPGGGTWEEHYEPGLMETRRYVYTYVTNLGEEGPPSPPSARVNVGQGQGLTVNGLQVGVEAGQGRIIDKLRIYRTATGNVGADFQFVDEVAATQGSYADEKFTADLAEVLPSTEWDPPPAGLRGLQVMPNGVMVGFAGHELCLSEPYQPHAWPGEYRLAMDYPVVAVGVFDTNIVVATEGLPYLITGLHPSSMTQRRLELTHGCVAKRSMVGFGHGCVYASGDGLVYVGQGGSRVVTDPWLTRDEWKAYNPASIHAYEWAGQYLGFYETAEGAKGGFLLDPRGGDGGLVHLDLYAVAGHRDLEAGALYLLSEAGDIVAFDAGEALTYRWRSKRFPVPRPVNLGAMRVLAADYSDVTVRVYADDQLRHEQAVASDMPFRLPAGYLGREWEIEVEGASAVLEIGLATAVDELLRG